MDPPEHTKFRQIIDGYFTDELVAALEPPCRHIARELVASKIEPAEEEEAVRAVYPASGSPSARFGSGETDHIGCGLAD